MSAPNETSEGRSIIGDAEIVLRSIRDQSGEYTFRDGILRVSTTAFNDRDRKPSVDREIIRVIPALAKKSDTDGVLSLVVSDVRLISNVKTNDPKGRPVAEHSVDVTPDPIDGNVSHCLIICRPALHNETVFKKLKEALARLAERGGWRVPPASLS